MFPADVPKPNNQLPSVEELIQMMKMTLEAVNSMIQRDITIKTENNMVHASNKCNLGLPELDRWNRNKSKEWLSRTKEWVNLAHLTFGKDAPSQIYARLKLACAEDHQVMTLINATENVGIDQTLEMIQKIYGSILREDEEILDKILEFSIKPGSRLATNWLYYKALVERSTQLNQYPGHETVSRIFMNKLRSSQFSSLAQQIRYKFPSKAIIPWESVVSEMERVYAHWDTGVRISEKMTTRKETGETKGRELKFMKRLESERPRSPCWGCGSFHKKGECSAKDDVCGNCGRRGHYTKLCRKKTKEVSALEIGHEFLVDTGSEINLFGKQLKPFVHLEREVQGIRSPIGGGKTVQKATITALSEDGETFQLNGFFDSTSKTNVLTPTKLSIGTGEDTVSIGIQSFPIFMKNKRPYIKVRLTTENDQEKITKKDILRKLGFTMNPVEDQASQLKTALEITHRRLMHPCIEASINTYRMVGIEGIRELVTSINESCLLCREKNATDNFKFYQNSTAEITMEEHKFGTHLTADIGFAAVKSEHGHTGVSIIKCKSTNYLWTRAICEKSEVQDHVIDVMNMLDDVRTLSTDNGREYQGRLTQYLAQRCVTHVRTPVRSQESAGSIEIAVKRIKILVATALREFRLSPAKWHWILRAATSVHNMIADKSKTSPNYKRNGTLPELDLLPTTEFVLTTEDTTSLNRTRGDTFLFIGNHSNEVQFDYLKVTETEIDWNSEHRRFITKLRPIANKNLLEKDYSTTLDVPLEGVDHALRNDYNDSESEASNEADEEQQYDIATINEDTNSGETENLELASLQFDSLPETESPQFLKAMEKELQNFQNQSVFSERWEGKQIIPTFWILKRKQTGAKARLTALGNLQRHKPITVTELPSIDIMRILLYKAVNNNLPITILDITAAFLHAELEEKVNIRLPKVLPPSCSYTPGAVVGIKKAIYGLKESPRLFVNKVAKELQRREWRTITAGLFSKRETFIFLYVDDAMIIGPAKQALEDFNSAFQIGKAIELKENTTLLGMNISITHSEISVSLSDWSQQLEEQNVRGVLTRNCIECDVAKPEEATLLNVGKKLIGQIGWAARLDMQLTFLLSHMSSTHSQHPCRKSIAALKKIVNYIRHRPPRMIFTKSSPVINIFTDASYCRSNGTARMGYVITVQENHTETRSNIISFRTKKIKKKLLSTFAAELEAIVFGLRHHACLKKALQEVTTPVATRLWTDSQTVYKSLVGGRSEEGFSAVLLEVAREYITNNQIECKWTPRQHQLADVLTHYSHLA